MPLIYQYFVKINVDKCYSNVRAILQRSDDEIGKFYQVYFLSNFYLVKNSSQYNGSKSVVFNSGQRMALRAFYLKINLRISLR